MFGKLKEKLKSWAKKFSEKAEATEKAGEIEEIDVSEEPKPKKTKKSKKETKKPKEETKTLPKLGRSKEKKKTQEAQTEKSQEPKEIEMPLEYNAGLEKYEPDLEKIKKLEEKFEEKEAKKHEEIKPIIICRDLGDGRRVYEKVEMPEEIKEEIKEPAKIKEEIKPSLEPEEEEITEEKSFFKRIFSKVLISKIKISEKDFESYSEELKMLLLENNVAIEVAEKIITELERKIIGKEILKKELESEIKDSLREIIEKILIEPFTIEEKIADKKESPFIILFCGINGSGKTTTIAKIANHLKNIGLSCVLAGADTFRAASIEQIKKHGDKLGIKVIAHDYGSDPASVGFDAVKYAQKNHTDVVLIDTAGRMHTEKNLLKEIEKISRVCKPDLKLFVGESITGNDAVEQVRSFDEAIGIDGIILAKADVDEKGGTALSVGYITRKPILYLGTGQEYKSITPFSKKKFVTELGL